MNTFLKCHCNGHTYILLYGPEEAPRAMTAVLKWYSMAEHGMCREHARAMQELILASAQETQPHG